MNPVANWITQQSQDVPQYPIQKTTTCRLCKEQFTTTLSGPWDTDILVKRGLLCPYCFQK